MSTQPSNTLIVDLQRAVERLSRMSAVMNLALSTGVPMGLLDVIVKPVDDASRDVRALLTQASLQGVNIDVVTVQIEQPIRDSLAEVLADAFNLKVPDTLEGL